MSKIIDNPLLTGATGTFAKIFVYRRVRGEIVMAKRPTRTKPPTDSQLAVQSAFQKAAKYAKKQIRKAEVKKMYEEGITLKKYSAFLVALSDYLHLPTITSVDVSFYTGSAGQIIPIDAADDFKVSAVSVEIQDATGARIEQGLAVPPTELIDEWIYTTTVANPTVAGSKVIVTVTDYAGNITVQTFDK